MASQIRKLGSVMRKIGHITNKNLFICLTKKIKKYQYELLEFWHSDLFGYALRYHWYVSSVS